MNRMRCLVLAVIVALPAAAMAASPAWPDVPDAVVVSRHPDGTPRTSQVRHPDGSRTEYETWPGGTRRLHFEYDAAGKEDGTCTRWHPTGAVFVEEHWEHGVRVGTWYYNSDDGRPNARFTFEKGREVSHETWFNHEKRWIPFEGPKSFPTP